jgi:hypothetical protein
MDIVLSLIRVGLLYEKKWSFIKVTECPVIRAIWRRRFDKTRFARPLRHAFYPPCPEWGSLRRGLRGASQRGTKEADGETSMRVAATSEDVAGAVARGSRRT